MKNERVGQLLETAQRTFVCDIRDKMDEIYGLLDSRRDIWSRSDVKRLLKFFHSISGTASTLGFSDLALIGEKWEEKLENVIDRDGQFDKMLLNEVKAVVKDLDQKVYNLIKNLDTPCGESDGSAGDDHEYTSLPNRGKILLVDDDITILKLLENAFTLEGYKVYICEDSLSTMDAITTIKPDLLILDIMMPKISGYQILKKIRSKPEYSEIYVIFLSAKVNVSDRIKGMKYGADDYITKPFVVEEVITRVEMVMRRSNKYKEKLLKDSLTGAYSRYYFNLRIAEEFERYKRNGTIFSIAFLDMDNYKAVNDRYGHQTGDYVLREVVSYLAKKLRKSDSIYRYGGEEFIILLPDTTAEKAVTVMNRLREGFTQFISVGKGKFCTTFSVGIKQVSESDENVMKLIDDADKAILHC